MVSAIFLDRWSEVSSNRMVSRHRMKHITCFATSIAFCECYRIVRSISHNATGLISKVFSKTPQALSSCLTRRENYRIGFAHVYWDLEVVIRHGGHVDTKAVRKIYGLDLQGIHWVWEVSIRHGGHVVADPWEEKYEQALQTKLSSCLTHLACLQSGTVGFQQREENLRTAFYQGFVDVNRKGSLSLLKLLVFISLLLGVASL